MPKSKAETVDGYLAELPEDRRAAISAVRQVVLENLPQGYEVMMQFGMIGYVIPLERYLAAYNGQVMAKPCNTPPEPPRRTICRCT